VCCAAADWAGGCGDPVLVWVDWIGNDRKWWWVGGWGCVSKWGGKKRRENLDLRKPGEREGLKNGEKGVVRGGNKNAAIYI